MYTVTFVLKDSQQLVHLTYNSYDDAMTAAAADDAMTAAAAPTQKALTDDYKTTAVIMGEILAVSILYAITKAALNSSELV